MLSSQSAEIAERAKSRVSEKRISYMGSRGKAA
jgi:hypothetical protein